MKVKFCPICDSEMKGNHFCHNCHSFVRKPNIMDIHFNTTTRGRGEVDCSYGQAHDHYDHGEELDRQHKDTKTFWEEYENQQRRFQDNHRQDGNRGRRRGKKATASDDHAEVFGAPQSKKKRNRRPFFSIVAWLLILNIIYLGVNVVKRHKPRIEKTTSPPIETIQTWEDRQTKETGPRSETNSGDMLLIPINDDELENYPDGCNMEEHFDIDIDDAHAFLLDWIAEHYDGVKYPYENLNSVNEKTVIDGSEYITLDSKLSTSLHDDDYNLFSMLSYDSGSGRLHSIYINYLPEDQVAEFSNKILSLSEEAPEEEEVENICRKLVNECSPSGSFGDLGDIHFSLFPETSDGSFSLTISPNIDF